MLLMLAMLTSTVSLAGEARVAAAASLTFALQAVGKRFHEQTGEQVLFTFGSSRNLMRQIIQGAPFELFMSADEASVDRLHQHGLAQSTGVVYATGQLVLFKSASSKVQLKDGLAGLSRAVTAGHLNHLAIANPETAPYGAAARQALLQASVWTTLKAHLVIGENAMQTAQFGLSGAADAALIPYSIALQPLFQQRGSYQPVAPPLYQPLLQKMVLLKSARKTAQAFYAYLSTPPAQAILTAHGLTIKEQP